MLLGLLIPGSGEAVTIVDVSSVGCFSSLLKAMGRTAGEVISSSRRRLLAAGFIVEYNNMPQQTVISLQV
jgi:hypothetical protein